MKRMSVEELWDEESGRQGSLCIASGPIIVGAGPAGLAAAACLKRRGIPSLILEQADGIAALWRHRTYDRIHLHLPKRFCELPYMGIPSHYPTYLSGRQFLEYLEAYAAHFQLKPRFGERVAMAAYEERVGMWRVRTEAGREYAGNWLVVATGENAEAVVPESLACKLSNFGGMVCHSQDYKNAGPYCGQKVLVVGCGNSGMEIALDLIKSHAQPSLVLRSSVHILPQEIFGKSTFAIILLLLKIFPVWIADCILLFLTWCKWRNTSKWGLPRPKEGPIAYKVNKRRTPVLDIGTLSLIKSGHIKVFPAIKTFTSNGAQFCDGQTENFDSIVLATGYRSNVKDWLIGENDHFTVDGLPKPQGGKSYGWKGRNGLYVVGMSGNGLVGTRLDAELIGQDIQREFKH